MQWSTVVFRNPANPRSCPQSLPIVRHGRSKPRLCKLVGLIDSQKGHSLKNNNVLIGKELINRKQSKTSQHYKQQSENQKPWNAMRHHDHHHVKIRDVFKFVMVLGPGIVLHNHHTSVWPRKHQKLLLLLPIGPRPKSRIPSAKARTDLRKTGLYRTSGNTMFSISGCSKNWI